MWPLVELQEIWTVYVCLFQGKDMYLLLENNMLNLVDPMDRSVLHSQPIASIRVWGVGRDNGRLVMFSSFENRFILPDFMINVILWFSQNSYCKSPLTFVQYNNYESYFNVV